MEAFVREKRFWLYTKLAEKEALKKPSAPKEFVDGEGFPYLGRSYRLLLVDDQDVPLKLDRGRFKLVRSEVKRGREHFIRWYTEHARAWLRPRVKHYADRLGVEPKGIEVRDLGYRWGSCGADGTVNFHWAAMLLPAGAVDYVVVHELVHLRVSHHEPRFWQLVERAIPDYEERRAMLKASGAGTLARGVHCVTTKTEIGPAGTSSSGSTPDSPGSSVVHSG